MFVRIFSAIVAALFATQSPAAAQSAASQSASHVTVSTSKGDFVIALDAKRAPVTVANFLRYVRAGHYDGTVFHRVIGNFMVQGGGYGEDLTLKPTDTALVNEADNGLMNERGTVAMARRPDPHSASTQFFVNLVDNPSLNHRSKSDQGWGYTVFGRVVDGMDVVDAIGAVETGFVAGMQDVPKEPVVIEKATVVE